MKPIFAVAVEFSPEKGVRIGLLYNFSDWEVVAQIEKELEEWAVWFVSIIDGGLDSRWDDFYEKCLALSKKLRDTIRDTGISVFCEPPIEDPKRTNWGV